MKYSLLATIILTLVLISISKAEVKLENKVVYGQDNRVESDQYYDARFVKKTDAIAIRINTKELKPISASFFSFPDTAIQDSRNLCEGLPFNEQPSPGDCTGFLVGPKTLVTAGHCMRTPGECQRYSWVFGFKVGVTAFDSAQIYTCKNVISQNVTSTDYEHKDFAVIELDRVVENATPLEFRKEGSIEKDTPLVVIGHPSGLPMKTADGANVKTEGTPALLDKLSKRPYFFAANLDTFGGNSGSPVFNQTTGLVEGILVKGREDYVKDTNYKCYRINKVEDDNKEDYELVMRIRNVQGI